MERIISFPALGITFTLNRIAFNLFGVKDIYWYGIIIGAGVLLAIWYAGRRVSDFALTQDQLYDTLIWALPSAIVGARLYYVIFEWSYYSQHLSEIIKTWEGGLAIYGGVIGAMIAVSFCAKKYRMNLPAAFDIASLGLLIGQMIGRWGNFVNGEAHGGATDSLFGMTVNGEGPFHPTFLYESVWNFIGFWILRWISKHHYKFRGQLFLFYMAWYGAGRMMIEGLRTDSLYLGGTGIRVSQLLAGVTCLVGIVLTIVCYKKKVRTIATLWNPHADAGFDAPAEEKTEEKE